MSVQQSSIKPNQPEEATPADVRVFLFERFSRVTMLVGIPFLLYAGYKFILSSNMTGLLVFGLLAAWFVFVSFVHQLPYAFRSHTAFIVLFLVGAARMLVGGLNGEGILIFAAYTSLVSLLISVRSGVTALFLSLITILLSGAAQSLGIFDGIAAAPGYESWIVTAFAFMAVTIICAYTLLHSARIREKITKRREELAQQLRLERDQFEARVEDRTKELFRRGNQLEAASEIARAISRSTKMDEILTRTTELIQSTFEFYHAGIFLVDKKTDYAVLRAATSEGGRQMLEHGHQLRRGSEGTVGYVVDHAQPRIAHDVGLDAVHFKNPMLPKTRSEMAVPIMTGEKVLGAIDVQSEFEQAFTQEDTKVLQVIADQLAIALVNANLVEQLQTSITELKAVNQRQTIDAWQSHLGATRSRTAYHFKDGELSSTAETSHETQQALRDGTSVVQTVSSPENGQAQTIVAIPIKLRDQTLGALNIRLNSPAVSPEMYRLLEAATERLALSLETARLLEEVQIRVEREHLVSDISSKVRSATDVENILRTTALELGRTLGLSEVLVQLRTSDSN